MLSGAYILAAGFVLGIQHAFDADHVVAVSNIVSEHKNLLKSSILGAMWGFGHTFTLLLAGLLLMVFKLSIPKKAAASMEMLVGVMLIILGALTLINAAKSRLHAHMHAHDGKKHEHLHEKDSHSHYRKRSFLVGMVHGLAGSAALMLLVLGTVKSAAEGLLYIAIFGLGSVLSMMLITTLIGLPFAVTAAKFTRLNALVRVMAGLIGVGLGSFIIYGIVNVQGLLA